MRSADDSFDEAFPDLYVAARRLAWRLTGDEALAEDIAADALAKTLVSWGSIGAARYRDAWVMRVTTNLALDAIRRRKRRREITPPYDTALRSNGSEADAVVLRTTLIAALSVLSKRQREAIVLVHLAGFTPAEAARSMRVSPSSVSAHLRRGLDSMRGSLLEPDALFADDAGGSPGAER